MKRALTLAVIPLIVAGIFLHGCGGSETKTEKETATREVMESTAVDVDPESTEEDTRMDKSSNGPERIVLGGGCFWCIEAVFELVEGVTKATSGYAGGTVANPTYEQVCSGDTGHAEVVSVEYDPGRVSLEDILDVFFAAHDPTTPNRQGNDVGTQYRSIILYDSEEQEDRVEEYLAASESEYEDPIVTEVRGLEEFYPAEKYHQDYYAKNPDKGYCQVVISPKIDKVRKLLDSP